MTLLLIRKIHLVLIFIVLTTMGVAKDSEKKSIVQPGEVLEYEVTYFGIGLGTIIIETTENEMIGDNLVHKAKSIMKSYSGIPFVSLFAIYQSWMDPSVAYSRKFTGNSKFMSDEWAYQEISFNYKNKKIR